MNSPTFIQEHFTVLIYPFYHSLTKPQREKQLQKLSNRWKPWWSRIGNDSIDGDADALASALDDTCFFLPSLREFLYPETTFLGGEKATDSGLPTMLHSSAGETEQLQRLSQLPCDALAAKVSDSAMLRLTLAHDQLAPLENLFLQPFDPHGEAEAHHFPFSVDWVDVMLFPQHVGFLAIKVKLEMERPNDKELTDFLYYLRAVHPPKHGWHLADWNTQSPETKLRFRSLDLVDTLLEGIAEGTSLPTTSLVNSLRSITQDETVPLGITKNSASRMSQTALGQIYGHSFRPYTYACLDGNNVDPKADERSDEQLFDSPVERVLYELATCTDTDIFNYRPHPIGKAKLMEEGHIALWENWQGMALHDNVVFLGTVANGMTLNVLPQNVEYDYLPLYLLALYQKIRLSFLSMELTRRDTGLRRNRKEADKLWDDFVLFRNHYWFHEVTPKPQGAELYQKFRQGLGVIPLYESVGEELHDLQEHYERKTERSINELLFFLAFIGLPISVLAELYGNSLIQHATWADFGVTTVIALMAWCLVGYIWLNKKMK